MKPIRLFFCAVVAVGAWAQKPPLEKTVECSEVRRLVQQLGSPKYSERAGAYAQLYQMGDPALAILVQLQSEEAFAGDAEIRHRLQALVAPRRKEVPVAALVWQTARAIHCHPMRRPLLQLRADVQRRLIASQEAFRSAWDPYLSLIGKRQRMESSMHAPSELEKLNLRAEQAERLVLEFLSRILVSRPDRPVRLKDDHVRIGGETGAFRLRVVEWNLHIDWAEPEAWVLDLSSEFPTLANHAREGRLVLEGTPVEFSPRVALRPHWVVRPTSGQFAEDFDYLRYHVRGEGFGVTTTQPTAGVATYIVSHALGLQSLGQGPGWSELEVQVNEAMHKGAVKCP